MSLVKVNDLLRPAENTDDGFGIDYQSSFTARGPLTPYADGICRIWQFGIYFCETIKRKSQATNNGSCELPVENSVRATTDEYPELVLNGMHDILTLPDINNFQMEITFETFDHIQEQKRIWKINKMGHMDSNIEIHNLYGYERAGWSLIHYFHNRCDSTFLRLTRGPRTYLKLIRGHNSDNKESLTYVW